MYPIFLSSDFIVSLITFSCAIAAFLGCNLVLTLVFISIFNQLSSSKPATASTTENPIVSFRNGAASTCNKKNQNSVKPWSIA